MNKAFINQILSPLKQRIFLMFFIANCLIIINATESDIRGNLMNSNDLFDSLKSKNSKENNFNNLNKNIDDNNKGNKVNAHLFEYLRNLVMNKASDSNEGKNILKSKNVLNCEQYPKYKKLHITTNMHENSDNFNVDILNNCEIQPMWRSRVESLKSCESPKRVIEGEDNIRRAFRFKYDVENSREFHSNNTSISDRISINRISLEFPSSVAESSLTKSKIVLNPGDVIDIYINYDCLNKENSSAEQNWYKIKFNLEFGGASGEQVQYQSFEFIKVCNASYIEALDISQIIVICFIFVVVYFSTKDILKSKFEVIVVEKYTEIRNPENLLLVAFVVCLVLTFLGVVGLFEKWISLIIFIISPISIAMIGEALMRYYDVLSHLEHRSYEIPFIGSISFLFTSCLGIGLFITLIYYYSQNWIFNNLIAVAVSIITIRLFRFTSFKLISIMFCLRFIYDLTWSIFNSQYYTENFKLSNLSANFLPIKFLCPEFIPTPFNTCNFLPIADVILPGILLTFSKIFDESKYTTIYFMSSNIALIGGLVINMFVFYSYKLPLPSFLFTGPFMMVTILVIANNKADLHKLLDGFSSTILENHLEKNLKKISFRQKLSNQNIEYNPPKP